MPVQPGLVPRRLLAVAVTAVVGLALGPGSALAAPGDLTYRDCITGDTGAGPGGTDACAEIATAQAGGGTGSGLYFLQRVVVSPDGANGYALSALDDAVAHFNRDPQTGGLTYIGCITGNTDVGPGGTGACEQIPTASAAGADSGLDNARGLAISPDGTSLYVAASGDVAIARFDRGSGGDLSYQGCLTAETESGPGGSAACTELDGAASLGADTGLSGVSSLTLSPDGASLYAAAPGDDAISRFDRNANGSLVDRGCITGEIESGPMPGGSGACTAVASASPAGANSGLDGLRALAVAPDELDVYALGTNDDALVRFDRAPTTGSIGYSGCLSGEVESGPAPGGSDACEPTPTATPAGRDSGFDGPNALAISPDGSSIYTTAFGDSVAHFGRSSTGGATSWIGCLTGDLDAGPAGSDACESVPAASGSGSDSGLGDLTTIDVAADGRDVYTGTDGDDSVARFRRAAADGTLDYGGCISGSLQTGPAPTGSDACQVIPSATANGSDSGLSSIQAITTSPDGGSLYAVTDSDASIARFDRELPPGPGPGPDTTAPSLSLDGKRKQRSRKRVTVKVSCDERCAVRVRAKRKARISTSGRGAAEVSAKRRKLKLRLKAARADLEAEETRKLRLQFKGKRTKRKVKRLLKRGRTIKLTLKAIARDEAGNAARERLRVKVTRRSGKR
jgi:hypothetical protein